eukprot:jgi/Bigna1/136549/aug1.34_g11257
MQKLFFSKTSKEQKWGRYTLTRVHASPNIYIIDNFLSDKEICHLGKFADGSTFKRSYTDTENGEKVVSSERTSCFTWLAKQQDSVIQRIEARAGEILGYSDINVEPFQLVRYTQGQMFKTHHDMGPIVDDEGIQIGEADPLTVHRANPVGAGVVKYGMNIWVNEKSMQGFVFVSRKPPRQPAERANAGATEARKIKKKKKKKRGKMKEDADRSPREDDAKARNRKKRHVSVVATIQKNLFSEEEIDVAVCQICGCEESSVFKDRDEICQASDK